MYVQKETVVANAHEVQLYHSPASRLAKHREVRATDHSLTRDQGIYVIHAQHNVDLR
jgi:hypothetical protein